MEWHDSGTVLSARPHGETGMLIEVFTRDHGRHSGIVPGGISRKKAAMLQPGSHLSLRWRARLQDQLGTFTPEPLKSRAGAMSDRLALLGLSATCALLGFALPDREPHLRLFSASEPLFDVIGMVHDGWILDYLRWEMMLLEDLGYGLDLTRCAVTGSRDHLAFVSPKTGRAVSPEGAGEWAPRLLPLPQFLLGQGSATLAEVEDGLRLTGHFLQHRLATALGDRPLPAARQRFLDALARA
ncbi:DNA repair protein RecO [Thioclava sp. SK-1]|uniref:DNA repair protein RecO n=1 Tax=Thioclava sp. SK-1 TaxID=1889770 RepID=UPI0008257175|nr:DNA repair protein RecO [Thioclava sp. SK-1]OCX61645.1 DNA repair protein RecO [Thioclava sp. SK-1]